MNRTARAVQNRTTGGIPKLPIFWHTFTGKESRAALFRYLKTVTRDFFWLQFSVKFGFRKIPILDVDHPLDSLVPFTPERVGTYLDFVAFWIRPIGYIGKRFGAEAERETVTELLGLIDRCYTEAAGVYRYRMTTTRRPKYYKGSFLTIHLFDPHYLCVPSLHVIVVVFAYTFYRKKFKELGMDADEAETLNRELYAGAVSIAETVLYIKQHSVNCIPAALYAMTRITPEEVTPTEAIRFIGSLFAGAEDVTAESVAKIHAHIEETYEKLLLEGYQDDNWITPLQRWLNAYSAEGFVH